jgi:hypothetical protein
LYSNSFYTFLAEYVYILLILPFQYDFKSYFKPELIDDAVKRWENWKEGEDAIMLFNVPENSVNVKKLDVRIHKFDVPWGA